MLVVGQLDHCNLRLPVAQGNGPRMSSPHYAKGQGLLTDSNGLLVSGSMGHAFGTVHIYVHTLRHRSASVATRILESLLDVPMNIPSHDCHTPHHKNSARSSLTLLGCKHKRYGPPKDLQYSLRFPDNQYRVATW